jgi:hypothetical protein
VKTKKLYDDHRAEFPVDLQEQFGPGMKEGKAL